MKNGVLAAANATSGSVEHSDSQFITPLDGHFDPPRIGLQAYTQQAASPLQRERHFGPAWKQMWVKDNAIFTHAQAGNTEHRCLPEGAKCAHMHAARRIAHVVCQVDLSSLTKIGLCQGSIIEPGSDEGMRAGLSELPCPVRGS
jgi:hypothetical protein